MKTTLPTATEITELEDGRHSARINGGAIESGFREGTDASGRGYAAIMQAIEDGAEVTPYVPHVDSPLDLLITSDNTLAPYARMLEDIAQEREDAGQFTSEDIKSLRADRKALRPTK